MRVVFFLSLFIKMNSDEKANGGILFSHSISLSLPLGCVDGCYWCCCCYAVTAQTYLYILYRGWRATQKNGIMMTMRVKSGKEITNLQAMHIHELNWELCIDLRFVFNGMRERAPKKYYTRSHAHKGTHTHTHWMRKNMIEINRAFLHTGPKMRNTIEKLISVSIMQ